MRTNILRTGYLLCLAGIYSTWMLTFSYLLNIQLPCGGSDGCTTVALSSAARVFGVPLPLFGLLFYLAMAGLTVIVLYRPDARLGRLGFPVAICGAAVSTGFTVCAALVLRTECWWCIASNVTACLLAMVFGFEGGNPKEVEQAVSGSVAEQRAGARCYPLVPPLRRSGKRDFFLVASAVVALFAMGMSANMAYRSAERFPWNPAAVATASVQEMIPSDSVVLNGDSKGPTVVMFVDLQCPACQEAFQTVYSVAMRENVGLAVRQRPDKIHVDSNTLAVLFEEAAQQGKGLEFLVDVFKESAPSRRNGRAVLRSLKAIESPELRKVARSRVARDRAFAIHLGLSQTPSLFIVGSGRSPEAVTADSLGEQLRVRREK